MDSFGRSYLQDYIDALAEQQNTPPEQTRQQIRHWYNGFCFAADSKPVYNPFSTFRLFEEQRFANHWFETGTPTFLVNLIQQQNYDVRQLDHLELNEMSFSTYELDELQLLPLLFQTGYLTIKHYDAKRQLYRLNYPNYEVETAFLERLLNAFARFQPGFSEGHLWRLVDALRDGDLKQFFEILKVFFANIPHDIQLAQES